jgi:hypothetical protein
VLALPTKPSVVLVVSNTTVVIEEPDEESVCVTGTTMAAADDVTVGDVLDRPPVEAMVALDAAGDFIELANELGNIAVPGALAVAALAREEFRPAAEVWPDVGLEFEDEKPADGAAALFEAGPAPAP